MGFGYSMAEEKRRQARVAAVIAISFRRPLFPFTNNHHSTLPQVSLSDANHRLEKSLGAIMLPQSH